MKEPINMLPCPGFGRGKMQRYRKTTQEQAEVSSSLLIRRTDGRKSVQNLWDSAQQESQGNAKSSVLACPDRKKTLDCVSQFIKKHWIWGSFQALS